MDQTWLWIGFNLFILIMLALDLGVFNRDNHEVSIREALIWSGIWVALAMVFNFGVYTFMGEEKGIAFLTGYLIEKSLSVDNIFVFVLIFSYFSVPPRYQHRILFWGILGALVMRAIFIFAGVALIKQFHWVIYVFGAFLIFTGLKMMFQKEKQLEPDKNPLVKIFKKFMPVTSHLHGQRFFVIENGVRHATPLFIVLLLIEVTDLIFAVDSIPAILAITDDAFIVYTSNVFAILGLRSLYFALAGITQYFHYLKYGLAAVLMFVGTKMVMVDYYKVPTEISLAVIAIILAFSVLASILYPPKEVEQVVETQ
ncbi:MAG TPA: TerC family protein [Rhodothermales bacterium]|nr:hypothetical protein [Bacteroidota bacterium]HRK75241.1 TerC family protein [Rhodothermales bacterium]HRR09530.1 TerC family protein [Rhodothermales bacterium]